MPGWVERTVAAARLFVRTVRSRSGGSISATARVVDPPSRMMLPPLGSLVEGAGRDAALDVGEAAGAGGERRLDLEALDRDGASVDPAQGATALEGGEVAAHGLGGDTEGVGECGDLDPAGTTCLGDDPLLPLRCVHRTPSSCVVPIVPSGARPPRKPPVRREVNRFGHPFLWF